MDRLSIPSLVTSLVASWWILGSITTLAGFLGWLYWPLFLLLPLPLVIFGLLQVKVLVYSFRSSLTGGEKGLLLILIVIWALHFTGVLVPETGFDAVWYHLPIVDQFTQLHRVVYLPEYYQSVNPLFSDLIFLLGYQVAGELGAKVVAYGLALTLMLVSYRGARLYLTRMWALLFVIQVSLIQVITWQAASFYVDVAKAVWELAALYLLVESRQLKVSSVVVSALFFGASLATKQFSLLLLPFLLLIVYFRTKKLTAAGLWLSVALSLVFPFYLHSWVATGQPFFAITTHVGKINEIGSGPTLGNHLLTQFRRLPYSFWYLVVEARDYVTPLLGLLFPFLILQGRKVYNYWPLLLFAWGQYLIWWLVPPASTRYALSGFIVLLLILIIAVKSWLDRHEQWHWPVIAGMLVVSGFLGVPRLYVFYRNVRYLTGQQTKTEYLQQFLDGNVDQHLRQWHNF